MWDGVGDQHAGWCLDVFQPTERHLDDLFVLHVDECCVQAIVVVLGRLEVQEAGAGPAWMGSGAWRWGLRLGMVVRGHGARPAGRYGDAGMGIRYTQLPDQLSQHPHRGLIRMSYLKNDLVSVGSTSAAKSGKSPSRTVRVIFTEPSHGPHMGIKWSIF